MYSDRNSKASAEDNYREDYQDGQNERGSTTSGNTDDPYYAVINANSQRNVELVSDEGSYLEMRANVRSEERDGLDMQQNQAYAEYSGEQSS